MPSKEETSERLHAALEDHDFQELGEALLEEEAAVEVEEVEEDEEEETAEARSSTREYVVLVQQKDTWVEVARATSSTTEGAVRTLGEDGIEDGAVYVAVPARNWNPFPPAKKRVTTTISFT